MVRTFITEAEAKGMSLDEMLAALGLRKRRNGGLYRYDVIDRAGQTLCQGNETAGIVDWLRETGRILWDYVLTTDTDRSPPGRVVSVHLSLTEADAAMWAEKERQQARPAGARRGWEPPGVDLAIIPARMLHALHARLQAEVDEMGQPR